MCVGIITSLSDICVTNIFSQSGTYFLNNISCHVEVLKF
jgi:hypothetical protein